MRRSLLIGALLVPLGLLLSRCFQPTLPDCAYKCGNADAGPVCPEDYECREDGYCHRVGTVVCQWDLPPPADLTVAPDLPDLSDAGADGGTG